MMKKVVIFILSAIVAINVVSVDVDPTTCSTNSFFEQDDINYE